MRVLSIRGSSPSGDLSQISYSLFHSSLSLPGVMAVQSVFAYSLLFWPLPVFCGMPIDSGALNSVLLGWSHAISTVKYMQSSVACQLIVLHLFQCYQGGVMLLVQLSTCILYSCVRNTFLKL